MLAFTLHRAIQAIGVMIAVGIIAFSMFRFAGDPVNQMVAIDTSAAERAAVRQSLGREDPVPVQFVRYFANAAQFKFGVSYQFRQPVASLLMERMTATLELAVCATFLAMLFGILMGVYSALRRDTVLTKIFQAVSLIGISLPTFLIGILLIYLFSVTLGWLPSFGRGDVVRIGWWTTGLLTLSGLKALNIPSVTLGLFQMLLIMRLLPAPITTILPPHYLRLPRPLPRRAIAPAYGRRALSRRRRLPPAGAREALARRGLGWLKRALYSDFFYSFRPSRMTMVAPAVTLLFSLLAIFASQLAVQIP